MVQSVSGHNSEQSIAHYISRPSYKVSPILCRTDLRITNHRGHKFPPSVTLLTFKTRIKCPPVLTSTASLPSVFFQLLQYLRKHAIFSAHKAVLKTKTDLIFPVFSLRFVDVSQFNSAFAVSFHSTRCPPESSLTVAWFFWTNHNSLLRIATNEIASFCIDNRLRQMAFSCSPKWAKVAFRVIEKDFEIKKL